ncbi:MAG: YafY family transcriptional regulator [Desulforhopalus sp.]|nr:YafY family transcriptional regulator [Desulforhopalus sp.]
MKIERLIAIIVLLLNRRKITAGELAERFEVSIRTIYRDIATLTGAGIPVLSSQGHDGGLAIPDGYKLSRQLLTRRDLEAMLATLRGVNQAMANKDLQRIIETLDNLLPKDDELTRLPSRPSFVVDITPWGPSATPEHTVQTVQRAVDGALLLKFSYTDSSGKSSKRTVEPHTLVYKGYAWYLLAYCRLRHDFRLFRLSRITGPNLGDTSFLRRDIGDISRFLQFDCGPTYPVVLRFSQRVRPKVEEYFPGAELTVDGDGFITAHLDLPDDPWLFSFILGFGADVEILSPASWRQRVEKIVADMKKLYGT